MIAHGMQADAYMGIGIRMNDMKATDFNELINKKEELHEDLQPYVGADDLFVSLKHPLVFDIFYSPDKNAICNHAYMQKLKYINKCIEDEDFSSIIWMYERPHRIEAFYKYVVPNLDSSSPKYWDALRSIMMDSENVWQWKNDYKKLIIDIDSEQTRLMMDEEERDVWENLPSRVTVYRGVTETIRNDSKRRHG